MGKLVKNNSFFGDQIIIHIHDLEVFKLGKFYRIPSNQFIAIQSPAMHMIDFDLIRQLSFKGYKCVCLVVAVTGIRDWRDWGVKEGWQRERERNERRGRR